VYSWSGRVQSLSTAPVKGWTGRISALAYFQVRQLYVPQKGEIPANEENDIRSGQAGSSRL
jgi:hypothetical protein